MGWVCALRRVVSARALAGVSVSEGSLAQCDVSVGATDQELAYAPRRSIPCIAQRITAGRHCFGDKRDTSPASDGGDENSTVQSGQFDAPVEPRTLGNQPSPRTGDVYGRTP